MGTKPDVAGIVDVRRMVAVNVIVLVEVTVVVANSSSVVVTTQVRIIVLFEGVFGSPLVVTKDVWVTRRAETTVELTVWVPVVVEVLLKTTTVAVGQTVTMRVSVSWMVFDIVVGGVTFAVVCHMRASRPLRVKWTA